MNPHRLRVPVLAALAAATFALAPMGPAARADGTARDDVVSVMERAADWQLANPSAKWKPLEWQNGAFYAGVMALAEVSASPRFREAMMRMGEANRWQLGPRIYHADDQVVGQTYADLYARSRDARIIGPLRERFDYILAHPKDGDLVFGNASNPDFLDRWSWCDALFMAPPAWAKLSQVTGDPRYLDYAASRWWATSAYLYDGKEHLYRRDSTYFGRRERNGRPVFWSRGNGWTLGGLVRMLQAMPADAPLRPRFVAQYREMAERVAGLQRPDGFWRSSLLDPDSYPMKESSGTGFFCYALAWGVNEGVLERPRYEAPARKAWSALLTCVEASGRLSHVQPVGATPVAFDDRSSEPYGVGAFLLAGREMAQLASPAP